MNGWMSGWMEDRQEEGHSLCGCALVLHYVCSFSHGSNVLVVGQDGRTLLHRAAGGGCTDCCSLLIRSGVPVNSLDNSIHK